MTIFDLRGNPVWRATNQSVIDVSELAPGIYFVRVEAGSMLEERKLVLH